MNQAFQFGDTFDWNQLEYENSCDSSTVRMLIGEFTSGISTVARLASAARDVQQRGVIFSTWAVTNLYF